MMRDILVYSIVSDQVHRDTINIGDTLTYKQVYNPAEMDVLSINPRDETVTNKIKCRLGQTAMTTTPKHNTTQNKNNRASGQPNSSETRGKQCYGCGKNCHYRNQCPARWSQCWYCEKVGHYMWICIKNSCNNFVKSETRKNTRHKRISQRKMNQNKHQAASGQ